MDRRYIVQNTLFQKVNGKGFYVDCTAPPLTGGNINYNQVNTQLIYVLY